MSRQIGLNNITIAELKTDDLTTTYDTPVVLERAITAKISPKFNTEKLFSDDNMEEILTSFDSIDVEIELNQLSIDSRAKLQGAKVVKGVLIETKNDIAPTIALGFKSKKSNGKYRYVWLYKGTFEVTDDDYATQEDKIKAQTAKLKGTFYARTSDGAYRIICDEDGTSVDSTILTSWFTKVQDPPKTV